MIPESEPEYFSNFERHTDRSSVSIPSDGASLQSRKEVRVLAKKVAKKKKK